MVKYFCCLPVGDWVVAFGAFYMMISFIHVNYVATDMYFVLTADFDLDEETQQDMIVSSVRLLMEFMVFITSALLIYAKKKERPALTLPWMVIVGVFDGLMMALATLRIGYYMQNERFSAEAAMTLYSIARGAMTALALMVVQSFRRQLQEQKHQHNNSIESIQESSHPLVAE